MGKGVSRQKIILLFAHVSSIPCQVGFYITSSRELIDILINNQDCRFKFMLYHAMLNPNSEIYMQNMF